MKYEYKAVYIEFIKMFLRNENEGDLTNFNQLMTNPSNHNEVGNYTVSDFENNRQTIFYGWPVGSGEKTIGSERFVWNIVNSEQPSKNTTLVCGQTSPKYIQILLTANYGKEIYNTKVRLGNSEFTFLECVKGALINNQVDISKTPIAEENANFEIVFKETSTLNLARTFYAELTPKHETWKCSFINEVEDATWLDTVYVQGKTYRQLIEAESTELVPFVHSRFNGKYLPYFNFIAAGELVVTFKNTKIDGKNGICYYVNINSLWIPPSFLNRLVPNSDSHTYERFAGGVYDVVTKYDYAGITVTEDGYSSAVLPDYSTMYSEEAWNTGYILITKPKLDPIDSYELKQFMD